MYRVSNNVGGDFIRSGDIPRCSVECYGVVLHNTIKSKICVRYEAQHEMASHGYSCTTYMRSARPFMPFTAKRE
jgi:hypothetical protein